MTDKMRPFFSICIPAYNASAGIAECLNSILAQTNNDWEIIVVDDGSTDDTLATARKWAKASGCDVRIESITNHGAYYARTHSYELANGQVIVNIDADDRLANEKALDLLHSAFIKTDADLVLYNACRPNQTNVRYSNYSNYLPSPGTLMTGKEFGKELALGRINNSVWEKAFKAHLGKDLLKMQNVNLGEDRLIMLQVADRLNTACILDEILYCYSPNEYSITCQAYHAEDILQEAFIESMVHGKYKDWKIDDVEASAFLLHWISSRLRKIASKDADPYERQILLERLCNNSFTDDVLTFDSVKKARGIQAKLLLLIAKMDWTNLLAILAKAKYPKGE